MNARTWLSALIVALAGCGEARKPESVVAPPETVTPPITAGTSAPAAPGLPGRDAELVNPDQATMVLLYFDLAGISPPIEQWLDEDMRVRMAPANEKPAVRDLVRREFEAGVAGVKKVGSLRFTLQANLSAYDPTYGEFTVRALAPSSVLEFRSFGHQVTLKFGNARAAQVWRVPATEAQAVRDRLGFANDASIDAQLRIRDVHAAPDGGSITTDVLEYELRENRGGTLLGRVQPASQT